MVNDSLPDDAVIHGYDGTKRVRVQATDGPVYVGEARVGSFDVTEIVLTSRVRSLVERGRLAVVTDAND